MFENQYLGAPTHEINLHFLRAVGQKRPLWRNYIKFTWRTKMNLHGQILQASDSMKSCYWCICRWLMSQQPKSIYSLTVATVSLKIAIHLANLLVHLFFGSSFREFIGVESSFGCQVSLSKATIARYSQCKPHWHLPNRTLTLPSAVKKFAWGGSRSQCLLSRFTHRRLHWISTTVIF